MTHDATTVPTVFIVDDDPAVRDSLVELISAMNYPLECYASADEFLLAHDFTRPGCLVLDVRMPGMSGIELQEMLVAKGETLPIVIVTGYGDVPMCVRSMRIGAIDFLEKPYQPQQLRESIQRAMQLSAQGRERQAHRQDLDARLAQLTPAEIAVVKGIVAGKTNKAIASDLNVSLRTVQFRRARILKKMQVNSKAALIEMVIKSQMNFENLR